MGLWDKYTRLKVPLRGDGLHIAPNSSYMKSVTGDRPLTRTEALELIEVFKRLKELVDDKRVQWYISTEIQRLRENVIRGVYGS